MNIDDIISAETAKLAFRRWKTFLLLMLVAALLGILTYCMLPRQYFITAEVIGTRYESDITPNNQSTAFSAAALLGGSTNDLPNINDFKLYMQLLTSPELGATIVDDPVMHTTFKGMWHKDHWQEPNTLTQHFVNFLSKLTGHKGWTPPDGFTVARFLSKNIAIVTNKDAKLITINTWNQDPELGKNLITLLSNRADDMVKDMAQKRFAAKVDFLEQALAATNVEETRTALGQALAKAETDRIYSQSNLPFAAEFLAPPATPAQPQFPQFSLTLWIFAGIGLLIFVFDVFSVKQTGRSIFVFPFRASQSKNTSTGGPVRGAVM